MIREDVLSAMTSRYTHLTKSGKKVADYIFENKVESQYLSITALAEDCGVAEATIFRFCKMLGFEGYNDFKLALAKSSGNMLGNDYETTGKVLPEDTVTEMSRKLYTANLAALTQTLELVDDGAVMRAVNHMQAASRILCFGQGSSMVMAMEMVARFLTVSPDFYCIEDSHLQAMSASLLSPCDVVMFFSYSGATRDMLDVLRPARERGAKIVVITRFAKSPAAVFADVILLCGSREGPLQSGSVAAKMAQLLIIDILFNEYCRRDPVQIEHNREQTANSIANKLL